jgi:hypothetical protein
MTAISFTDSNELGKFNPPSYPNWLGELRALFPVPDEFLLADAIYHFQDCFTEGLTPQEAYAAFDEFVSAET